MLKINEIIIVEGKADTDVIKHAVEAETIETNGSALSSTTLAAIKTAANTRGIIIFTDPDFNGERLRKLIAQVIPDAKHAFLTKDEAGRMIPHHSLGIEYATADRIEAALAQVYDPSIINLESDITQADLLHGGLIAGAGAAQRRQFVAEELKLGYVNGKQLLKRLHLFGIKRAELEKVIKQIED